MRIGILEEAVLLATFHLQPQAYGVSIRDLIRERTGDSVSFGAIYTTLDRLTQKGFLEYRDGDATPERGGRAKRYFRLTFAGRQALTVAREQTRNMWDGVESFI